MALDKKESPPAQVYPFTFMKKYITIVSLCSIALLFAGCATSTNGTRTVSPAVAQLGVTYATMKVIENNPAYGPRIVAIAQSVKAVAGGETVSTVALLDAYIRSQIDWSKITSPADRQVISLLLTEIKYQMEQRIGTGVLTSDKLIVVSQVARWIEDAAKASELAK